MYTIKHLAQDFQVIEHIRPLKEGSTYQLCKLTKTDMPTIDAILRIAKQLNIKESDIQFGGIKDRKAVTTQYITLPHFVTPKRFSHEKIQLEHIGNTQERMHSKCIIENEFIIRIRNVQKDQITKKKTIINTFGTQRFSKNNVEVAIALLQRNFRQATHLIFSNQNQNRFEKKARERLEKEPTNYIQALKELPQTQLKLYISAYQSFIWNHIVQTLVKEKKPLPDFLPLIGFDIEQDSIFETYIQPILERDRIDTRQFIFREIPYLTAETILRKTQVPLNDFAILQEHDDGITVTFKLPRGSYATEAIDQLLKK
ncbi:MAG: tRNA pseudouridine(13) synthase TruD [Candidatus Woesearchaeota archaeon]